MYIEIFLNEISTTISTTGFVRNLSGLRSLESVGNFQLYRPDRNIFVENLTKKGNSRQLSDGFGREKYHLYNICRLFVKLSKKL